MTMLLSKLAAPGLACRAVFKAPPRRLVLLVRRWYHPSRVAWSTENLNAQTAGTSGEEGTGESGSATGGPRTAKKEQPFRTTNFTNDFEWDPFFYENPIDFPVYKGRNRVLAHDDYKRRPKVGFDNAFETLEDAQINLSWLTHGEQKAIYELYKECLKKGYERYGVTSHEYIMREIAKNKNMSVERIAACVRLQYDEELDRLEGREVEDDVGEYMDNCYMTEIRECYKAYGQRPPARMQYTEFQVGGPRETKVFRPADDIFDIDGMWLRYKRKHMPEKAKKLVENHVWKEDVYDETIPIHLNKETKHFMEKQKEMTKRHEEVMAAGKYTPDSLKETDETNPNRRRRWKYVAQLVNTRELKRAKRRDKNKPVWHKRITRYDRFRQHLRKSASYTNHDSSNTLIEYDGSIRPANLKDIKGVAWKPIRHDSGKRNTLEEQQAVQEIIYEVPKLDWLNYINGRPHTGVFGPKKKDGGGKKKDEEDKATGAEAAAATDIEKEAKEAATADDKEAALLSEDEGDSSSSSDEEEGGASSDEDEGSSSSGEEDEDEQSSQPDEDDEDKP